MNTRLLPLACCLLAIGPVATAPWAAALAADPPPRPDPVAPAPAPADITMRIIENPDAMAPEAITRRLELPVAPARKAPGDVQDQKAGPERGKDARQQAREASESAREFGAEAAERAREMRDQAAEQREDFGRSRAEEMKPERPEPPRPPRP